MIDVEGRVAQIVSLHVWYQGQLEATLLSSIAVSSRDSLSHKSGISNLQKQTESQMLQIIDQIVAEASADAILESLDENATQLTAEEQDRIQLFSDAYRDYLQGVVSSQLLSDANQSIRKLRNFWLQVELVQYRQGVSRSSAVIIERERILEESYIKRDSAGKAWKSSIYLRVETSNALSTLFNAIAVYLLATRGTSMAQIYRPGHESDGQEFELADYEKLTARYFHPGSTALVQKITY